MVFVVISKKFLRSRKIMVMHSNERGECDLRTLVDRQRKRLVDVVVRLHGPTDQAMKLRHLRVLAHVQLDDDPRTPIQQSRGRVPSARWRGDDLDVLPSQGFA